MRGVALSVFEKDSLHYLCLMRAITDPTKKSVRQTARRQMSEARAAKKQGKEFIRGYDKAGGFTFEGQKQQAKKNVRSAFRRKKKAIRGVKKAILNNI